MNSRGTAGDKTTLAVALDTVAPEISLMTFSGSSNFVTVVLSEAPIAGTNRAADWLGVERAGAARQYYLAETVEVIDALTRRISVPFQEGIFDRVHYIPSTPDSVRYEDRAGNKMSDTL